jgi:hypothetical protein
MTATSSGGEDTGMPPRVQGHSSGCIAAGCIPHFAFGTGLYRKGAAILMGGGVDLQE